MFLSECADSNFSSPNLNIKLKCLKENSYLFIQNGKKNREAKRTANSVGHSSMSIKDQGKD